MNKRTQIERDTSRWATDPDKAVVYEMTFKGDIIKPGQRFKIKNDRTIYTFHCLVTNIKSGTTWIECACETGYYSFRPEKMYKLVGIKKSRRKKVAIA